MVHQCCHYNLMCNTSNFQSVLTMILRLLLCIVPLLVPSEGHNSLPNTFSILARSLNDSLSFLFDVPVNMGRLELFLADKEMNAPLMTPLITNSSNGMASSGSSTQQTLWGSVVVEGIISYVAYDDTGVTQLYETDMMAYRDNDPASCPATTSTIPSENTGASHEQARLQDCLVDWHIDATGVQTTSFVNKDYDPRLRPWYMKTVERKAPNWSDL